MDSSNEELLNNKQAANYLSVTEAFLHRDRWAGATIPFVRVGSRTIRYRKSDLDDFVNSRINKKKPEGTM